MKLFIKSVIVMVVFFLLAFEVVQFKYQKTPLVRDPASVSNDLTSYSGERLSEEIKRAVLSDLVFSMQSPWVIITLGHFRFVDVDGRPKWGCESFEKVNLKFVADSAVDGQLTEMIVESKCYYHDGAKTLEPIKIPLKEVVTEYEPNDGEINFNYEVPVTINFQNLPGSFPRKWYLENVKLIKSTGDVFEINSADLAFFKKNLTLDL